MHLQRPAGVQKMSHFGPDWSGDAQILWGGVAGETLQTVFHLSEGGSYRIAIQLTAAPDYGRCTVMIGNKILAEDIDTYSDKVELLSKLDLGELSLEPGDHLLKLTMVGANPKAKSIGGPGRYLLGVDYLDLARLDQPEPAVAVQKKQPTAETDPAKLVEPVSFVAMKSMLAQHCYQCHGSEKVKGDLNLEALSKESDFLADSDLTRKIAEALTYKEMPPEDEPQPDAKTHAQMLATVNSWLDRYIEEYAGLPVVTMRRLNRFEYNNVVRDLFELKGDIYPLPEKVIRADVPYFNPQTGRFPESVKLGNRPLGKRQIEEPMLTGVNPFAIDLQAEHGFNNRGDELSLSPILMESYLKLAQSIINAPELPRYSKRYDSLFTAPSSLATEDLVSLGKGRLLAFIKTAFRGMAPEDSLDRFPGYFEREFISSADFTSAMKRTVSAVLASPRFLYLVERQLDDDTMPLSAFELATRLSFFLWSSSPDKDLLAAAESGDLLTPAGMAAQVNRMLESPKSQALSQNFARQWMRLDQLINAVPDFKRFNHYYSRFGCEQFKFGLHAMAEPLLLFESIMVEDRSIMLLVDSQYSWRTHDMDIWYDDGEPFKGRHESKRFETYQSVYRKVKVKDRRQGGIMTTAATLTMTSDPLRTNPINRGAWALTVMFNQPPPPPPDVVPEIEADDAEFEAKGVTLRQRLKQHQENQSCASCHSKIDPLGFAFENFDAVGRWRENYRSGLPIDASGDLFGENPFTDIVGFKDAILAKPEQFMRGFVEHLFAYALGRELQVADKPAVDKMVSRVVADHGQFTTVIHEITRSYPFRNKSQLRSTH